MGKTHFTCNFAVDMVQISDFASYQQYWFLLMAKTIFDETLFSRKKRLFPASGINLQSMTTAEHVVKMCERLQCCCLCGNTITTM